MKLRRLITFESPITNISGLYTLIAGLICILISAVTPSFMSPDEFDHVKRAYWLAQDVFILDTPPGTDSGEMLDTGLQQYMSYFLPFVKDRDHKVSINDTNLAASIKWSNVETFSSAPGTGYYFPVIYAPQAFGLWSGKVLGLTIEKSYHLARFMALIVAIAISISAFEIHRPPPLTIALIMLPMTLFQLASASLDGPANALAILAISLFIKSCLAPKEPQQKAALLLAVVLFILVSSRTHLIPMLALPFAAYLFTKVRSHLIAGSAAVLAVGIWLITAITHTVDTRVITAASTFSIAKYYISQPVVFVKLVYDTLITPGVVENLEITFLGVLGWLDTAFAPAVYKALGLMIIIHTFISLSVPAIRQNIAICTTLLICSACSALMIYFALLITWNPHPANFISGIQGRYLFIPAVMLGGCRI